jgi:hypothetical protein
MLSVVEISTTIKTGAATSSLTINSIFEGTFENSITEEMTDSLTKGTEIFPTRLEVDTSGVQLCRNAFVVKRSFLLADSNKSCRDHFFVEFDSE